MKLALYRAGLVEVGCNTAIDLDDFRHPHFEIRPADNPQSDLIATISFNSTSFVLDVDPHAELEGRSDLLAYLPRLELPFASFGLRRAAPQPKMYVRADRLDSGHLRIQFAACPKLAGPEGLPEKGIGLVHWTKEAAKYKLAFAGAPKPDEKGGPLVLWPGKEDFAAPANGE